MTRQPSVPGNLCCGVQKGSIGYQECPLLLPSLIPDRTRTKSLAAKSTAGPRLHAGAPSRRYTGLIFFCTTKSTSKGPVSARVGESDGLNSARDLIWRIAGFLRCHALAKSSCCGRSLPIQPQPPKVGPWLSCQASTPKKPRRRATYVTSGDCDAKSRDRSHTQR